MPDAALVAACPVDEIDPALNIDLAIELARARRLLADCAAKVDGVGQWRRDAIRRAEEPPTG